MQSKLMMITTLVLCGCGAGQSSASIIGMVVDHAGRPLQGATVSIKQSAYSTASGPDGRYSIPFAPGTFTVVYGKDGMTSMSVEHSIQGEVEFPAADIQLLPVPTDPGVYLLADSGPIKLEQAALDKQTVSQGWFSTEYKYFCTGEGSVSAPSGKVRFIDTSPATLLPAKAGGYGLILQEEGDKASYNGVFKDTKDFVGDENLVIRTFDAKPGNYAFVAFSERGNSGLALDDSAGCLPFKVQ